MTHFDAEFIPDDYFLGLQSLVIIAVAFIIILFIGLSNIMGYANQSYMASNSLLNLSVHTTLFNSSVLIAPAFNTTLCGTQGCMNYSHGSNRTFIFNISNAGYLYMTSSNGQNLTVIASETYAPPIPSSNGNRYFSSILDTVAPLIWTTAILNATDANVVIPVAPGNASVVIYNNERVAYYGAITIRYFK